MRLMILVISTNCCSEHRVGDLALLLLASGWLVRLQPKANVPNVCRQKNFNFFCAVGKKLKQEAVGCCVGKKSDDCLIGL